MRTVGKAATIKLMDVQEFIEKFRNVFEPKPKPPLPLPVAKVVAPPKATPKSKPPELALVRGPPSLGSPLRSPPIEPTAERAKEEIRFESSKDTCSET